MKHGSARARIVGVKRHEAPEPASRVRRSRAVVPARAPSSAVVRLGKIHAVKTDNKSGDTLVIQLLKDSRPRYDHFREGTHVHVSDIISKCARKIALARRLKVKHHPRQLIDGHAITFAQGHAIHNFIKERFIKAHPDKVWARWGCPCGDTLTEPMVYSEITADMSCDTCGKQPSKYHEVDFPDDELEVVGSPDLILYLEEYPAYYPIEIKSMSAKQWDELERPVPDHVVQNLFYWKLLRERGYPVPAQISILYVKKEYTWKSPYKEFVIRPEQHLPILDVFVGDLKQVAAARDPKNPLPPRLTCGSIDAPEAKQCPVCVSCFQLP